MQRVEIEVDAFDYDDQNEAHLAEHGVTPDEIDSVLYNKPRFFANLPGRSATHVMIGLRQTRTGSITYRLFLAASSACGIP